MNADPGVLIVLMTWSYERCTDFIPSLLQAYAQVDYEHETEKYVKDEEGTEKILGFVPKRLDLIDGNDESIEQSIEQWSEYANDLWIQDATTMTTPLQDWPTEDLQQNRTTDRRTTDYGQRTDNGQATTDGVTSERTDGRRTDD